MILLLTALAMTATMGFLALHRTEEENFENARRFRREVANSQFAEL